MELTVILGLFLAGAGAGVINTVGGGGSILTLPALIFLGGLDSVSANGTNRLGIIFQNLMALWQFRKGGVRQDNLAIRLTIIALPGAFLGSMLAANIPDETFRPLLAWMMLGLLLLVLFKPKPKLLKDTEGVVDPLRGAPLGKRMWLGVTIFVIAVYMGFLQAGGGIMVLVALGWFLRMDLVLGNYVKLFMILCTNVLSFGVFLFNGTPIYWVAGIMVFAGQISGAYMGSWIALEKGEGWMKAILAVSILASSAKLLGLF